MTTINTFITTTEHIHQLNEEYKRKCQNISDDTLENVKKLLQAELNYVKWLDSLENTGVSLDEPEDFDLLSIALDLVGVPNEEFLTDGWSRDYQYDLFHRIAVEEDDVDRFLNILIGREKDPIETDRVSQDENHILQSEGKHVDCDCSSCLPWTY